jgi:hypothetical protein
MKQNGSTHAKAEAKPAGLSKLPMLKDLLFPENKSPE